jgi:hypothetical protein
VRQLRLDGAAALECSACALMLECSAHARASAGGSNAAVASSRVWQQVAQNPDAAAAFAKRERKEVDMWAPTNLKIHLRIKSAVN